MDDAGGGIDSGTTLEVEGISFIIRILVTYIGSLSVISRRHEDEKRERGNRVLFFDTYKLLGAAALQVARIIGPMVFRKH